MQIKTSKETAELNFKQNVLSNNRRDWIETFRQEVSQFLSMCVSISLNVGRSGYEVEDIKNLSKNISSLQLICYSLDSNSDKDSFLKELKILQILVLASGKKNGLSKVGTSSNKLKVIAQRILENEWNKVINGE